MREANWYREWLAKEFTADSVLLGTRKDQETKIVYGRGGKRSKDMNKSYTAYIKEDKSDKLWLIVERTPKRAKDVDSIMGKFRIEDDDDNVAYPILRGEVKAIMRACQEYLEELEERSR